MSWSSGFKLPSFDELKKSMDEGVKKVNANLKDVGTHLDHGMKAMNESVKGAAEQMKESAKHLNVNSSEQLFSKVKGVFDLDSLNTDKGRKGELARLAKLEIFYITPRVLVMGFPDAPKRGRTSNDVATALNQRHGGEYMVWNLSEKSYDTSVFRGQVVDYSFPGYPAPPLGALFKLCMSMESWLNSDEKNVVVIHCMTGKGRSLVLAACLLEWVGRAQTSVDALTFACKRRRVVMDQALVPTQLRYAEMFHDVLVGKRPSSEPILLKQLVFHCVPNMLSTEELAREGVPEEGGCRPYLQLYKDGKCIFSSLPSDVSEIEEKVNFYPANEKGQFIFTVDCVVEGDILLRLRHIDVQERRGSSMFRFGFHTGYTQKGTLTLHRAEMDSASVDPRFADDVMVELEFQPVVGEALEDHTSQVTVGAAEDIFEQTWTTQASFWDEVEKKRELAKNRTETEKAKLISAETIQSAQTGAVDEEIAFSILDEDEDETPAPTASNKTDQSAAQSNPSDNLHDELNALDLDSPLAEQGSKPPQPPAAMPPQPHTKDVDDSVTSQPPVEMGVTGHATVVQTAAEGDDFMDELEALEKDLGLSATESSNVEEKGSTLTRADTGKASPSSADPDLEELEQYLNDL